MTDDKKKRITKKFKQEQLDKIYSFDPRVAIEIDTSVYDKENHAFYNEVTRDGAEKMIEVLSKVMGKSAVFYDLGCGQGKLIMHLAIQTKMSKIVGIELSKERYDQALKNAEEIEFPFTQPSIINADYRTVDLSDATVVYFDNNGYTAEETMQVFSLLPKGCLVIYQAHGERTGDRFFPLATLFAGVPQDDSLFQFWNNVASYRYI